MNQVVPLFFVLTSLARVLLASGASSYVQPKYQFEAALANNSSSPSFVLITVIDTTTEGARTGCVPAPFLIAAIVKEKGVSFSPQSMNEARNIALAKPDHVYRLSKHEALANLAFNNNSGSYTAACKIIRAGHPAFMTDRTGAVTEGQP